ncbi:MAG: peptidoglycan DD-metalloendopeptidase family protein [Lachnospiraceae bacterium]|nr:peptidoglycan DD-metalloendopeptidase family protein [Lachnospiraceae bacterium]
MKGDKKEYQNKKRLYLLGLCGVLAVSGTVYAVTRKTEPQEQQKELVDLNDGEQGLPDNTQELVQNGVATPIPPNPTQTPQTGVGQETKPGSQTAEGPTAVPKQLTASGEEKDPVLPNRAEPTKTPVPTVQTASNEGSTGLDVKTEEKGNQSEIKVVKNDEEEKENPPQETAQVNNPTAQELKFSEEDGLGWPMSGNVVKNYSADKLVYFETLGQFKTNPCIFIAGEKGSPVVAAADGIVTEVKKEDKTGHTLVMDIGGGYTLTYGQIGEVAVKIGDYVEAGQELAKLATVTKYYRLEGDHLYFQVQKDGQNVNPMTLIRNE